MTLPGFLLLSLLSYAPQATAPAVEGIVLDATNAAVPGAEVTLRTLATNTSAKTVSSPEGAFRFLSVPTGNSEISVKMPGFAVATRKIDIPSGGLQDLRITINASTISEQVAVSASAEMLQVSRATQSASITSRELQALPTASRNYTHLIAGEAGVAAALPDRTGRGINIASSPGAQADDGNQSLNPSVNGARPTSNAVSVNGVDTTNMMNGGGSLGNNITVPLDSLEAVEVQTALYTASAGRNGGANIQMITKGGANDFHGSASHFLQNEALSANDFF